MTALTRKEVVGHLAAFRNSSAELSWRLFLGDCALYGFTFAGVLTVRGQLPRLLLSVALGLVISRIFVLGHDACHQSLFASKTLNRVAGRILFLPSLTPYSLWAVGHNTVHHAYANLKGRDPVWVPLSPQEYRSCSRGRRLLERLYRTVPGLALYYLVEMWWLKLYFPSRRHVGARRAEHLFDCWLVTFFFSAQAAFAVIAARGAAPAAIKNFLEAIVLPFLVWNWVVGFTVYVHHTHPTVRWFNRRERWLSEAGQMESSLHVVFPRFWSAWLHNIYDHTAHHADARIPSYRLREAQAHLETVLRSSIHVRPWNWEEFKDTLRTCQLYDFDRECWLPFPTEGL